jgi:hypothetical protein
MAPRRCSAGSKSARFEMRRANGNPTSPVIRASAIAVGVVHSIGPREERKVRTPSLAGQRGALEWIGMAGGEASVRQSTRPCRRSVAPPYAGRVSARVEHESQSLPALCAAPDPMCPLPNCRAVPRRSPRMPKRRRLPPARSRISCRCWTKRTPRSGGRRSPPDSSAHLFRQRGSRG